MRRICCSLKGYRCWCAQALADAANLKVAGDKETAAAEAEWRQLTQLIEHDRKQKVPCISSSSPPELSCPCTLFLTGLTGS